MLELAEGIAKKLLHTPQVALKKGGGDPVDGALLLSAVQRLFNLEVAEIPVAAGDGAGRRDVDDQDESENEPAGGQHPTVLGSGKATGT
jgi:hypothetical protein